MQLQTPRQVVVRTMLSLHFPVRVVFTEDHPCDLFEFRLAYFTCELEVVFKLGDLLVF